jgi:hypothetical protein
LRIIGEPKLPSVFLQVLSLPLKFYIFPASLLSKKLDLVCSLIFSTDYRLSVGFLGNMARLMEIIPLPISLGNYAIWQRHILMMKLLRYLSYANDLFYSRESQPFTDK